MHLLVDCDMSTCTYSSFMVKPGGARQHSHGFLTTLLIFNTDNLNFQMQLMRDIRESIKQDKFPEFVQSFMKTMFPDNSYPDWAVNALASVNIILDTH